MNKISPTSALIFKTFAACVRTRYLVNMSISVCSITFTFSFVNVPALYSMIDRSAVNSRFGRILLSSFNFPSLKSLLVRGMENRSFLATLVIWQRITSLPPKSATTNAGLLLEALRSEKGKGMTTTSPFTSLSMLHLPLWYSSLLQGLSHLQTQSAYFLLPVS